MKSSHSRKIFGLGLSRTGTKSLTKALTMLGYEVVHYPVDDRTYSELIRGNYKLTLLEDHDGITDITTIPFYPHLDRAYPGSKFILTTRDKEPWLASMERFWSRKVVEEGEGVKKPETMRMRRFLRAAVYGTFYYSRERLAYVHDNHRSSVRSYFAERPDALLELDILNGDGWDRLCTFLDVEIPEDDFPFVQSKKQITTEL